MNPSHRSIFLEDLTEVPAHLDRDDQVYLLIDMEKMDAPYLDRAISYGFRDPVIITSHHYRFLGEDSPPKLCLHLSPAVEMSDENRDHVWKQIKYSMYHFNTEGVCQTRLQLDRPSLEFLYYHTRHHRFKSDTNKRGNQREISGKFQMIPSDPDLVQVTIDPQSTKVGDKENASYHESVGSFHTHPYEAYKRHSVCVAFPSGDDFATTLYLYATGTGAFHVLSSIEGIYVITLKPSFVRKHPPREVFANMKKWENYVMKRYDIGYPECSLDRDNHAFWGRYIGKYLKKMNKLKVFYIQFKPWEKAHEPFDWQYRAMSSNCVVSDKQIRHIQRLRPASSTS